MPIAQLNIATAKYPLDQPELKDFVDNLDRINHIAEQSPGFIWRLKDDSGNATNIQLFDNPNVIVNMSVWKDVAALKHFMFKPDHLAIMKRKREWFIPANEATYVLWEVADGHVPTLEEAMDKLQKLRTHGESAEAFSFKSAQ